MGKDKVIVVVCGVIFKNDTIFIARKKAGKYLAGYWEFPGGKVKPHESYEQALSRELLEELGMTVWIETFVTKVLHPYDSFSVELLAYKCDYIAATFELTDHDSYKWVPLHELRSVNLAPADLPILDYLDKNNI